MAITRNGITYDNINMLLRDGGEEAYTIEFTHEGKEYSFDIDVLESGFYCLHVYIGEEFIYRYDGRMHNCALYTTVSGGMWAEVFLWELCYILQNR